MSARRILAIGIAAILGATLPYLAGGFVAWNFNPGEWDYFGRFVTMLFTGPFGLLGGMAASQVGEEA